MKRHEVAGPDELSPSSLRDVGEVFGLELKQFLGSTWDEQISENCCKFVIIPSFKTSERFCY